ncbi:type II secretion system minor pseudopilin GspK [Photobacterium alginatilyticum]|uniref:Type II secretion system protein K n=1 Tax=Photobacterium alginatilyticum TaxID=1775171 RepID=A0ABW9YP55_9GAMM|nr:type II secretion system minor pseudopilin GspK [Photobacterium alginatilyticum]NBI54993.1 general secretion pathway protein GspK [Photobacterium alginatilyticum]
MKQQKGVALIVVLMLLALMTLLAAQMSERLQLNFYRVENQVQNQQAYWYALGMEELGKVAIQQGIDDSDTVNLSQAWATQGQRYPLDGGEAIGDIVDRQACFNLNALSGLPLEADRTKKPFLVRVLQSVLEEAGVENYDAEVIADSSWEFVDPAEAINSAFGAGDSTYEGFQPPYLPPSDFMADVSEFRAVNGVSAQVYRKVKPLLCAIPTTDMLLNVNTLYEHQAALLVGLFAPELSLSDAQKLIADRPYDGWQNVDDFMAEAAIARLGGEVKKQAKTHLAVSSDYFQLDTEILVDRSRVRLVALLKRDGQEKVTVIRRRYGGISERISDDKAK